MEEEQLKLLEKLLKALANYRRLLIIKALKQKTRLNVGQVARMIELSFRATSRHLNNLYKQGVVIRQQKNLNMYYSLAQKPNKIIDLIKDKL